MRSCQFRGKRENDTIWLDWIRSRFLPPLCFWASCDNKCLPSDFGPDSLSRPSLSHSTFRPSVEPSWILHTTATRPCRRPPPTSTPAIPGPRKQRMMGRCPVTPSGCGSLYWPRLATLWWWRWFVSVPSDRSGSRNMAAAGWRGKVYSLKIYFLYKWCKIALLLAF